VEGSLRRKQRSEKQIIKKREEEIEGKIKK
jgi:hypothetical protein